tara:strand:- start:4818 stop:6644 length:1827 start_codon:yes stop_codon:yes gene_type:complete
MSKKVYVKLAADTSDFQKGMMKARKLFNKTAKNLKRTGKTLTMSMTAPLTAFAAASIKAFDTQQKAIAQVEQGLKTTGGLVGRTSKELQKMASDLQSKTLFGDEVILKDATAQLLTFTNITGQQFDRTQVAALDLATRLDGDLKSASIQLGKALNDPVANLSALSRSGIQFSEDQKKVINSLAKTGRLAEAQTIILDELEKQYGGSAEAAARAGAGGLKQLQNKFGDLMEQVGKLLLPVLNTLVDGLNNMINAWSNLDEGLKIAIVTLGGVLASIGPLVYIFGSLVSVVGFFMSPLGAVVAGLAALAAAVIYVVDNLEAFKERFSDIGWWKNAVIQMLQWFIEFNPMSLLIKGFNKVLKFFRRSEIPNPYEAMSDGLESLKVKTKDYEHEFGSFSDAISNAATKTKNALFGLGSGLGVGADFTTPTGVTTTATQTAEPATTEGNDALTVMTEKMQGLVNITQELGYTLADSLSSGFAQAVTSGESFMTSFIEIFKNIAKQIVGMIVKAMVLAALFTYLGIGDANGMTKTAGFFKNFETSLTGKASGGAVVAGQPYMVGERGPEMFMPGQSGTIIPNQNVGGSVIPDVRITGDDLLIVFDKAQRRKERR